MMDSKDHYSKNIAPTNYKQAGDTIGKYVGQEKLFAPKKKTKLADRESAVGPNPSGQGAVYSGLTSVY